MRCPGRRLPPFRESVTRDTVLEFLRQGQAWNVTNLLDQVVAPTLLVQEKADKHMGLDVARELATLIPDARVGYPGRRLAPGEARSSGAGINSVPA